MGQGNAPISQCACQPKLGDAPRNDESKLYDEVRSFMEDFLSLNSSLMVCI